MITERNEIWLPDLRIQATPDHIIHATTEANRSRALRYRLKRLELQYNPKGFMKQIATFVFLLALAIPGAAQTVDVGGTGAHSTNYAPPGGGPGGGGTFPGAYAKVSYDLPHGFEVLAKARASRTPQLQTQFTTDEPMQKPAAELRLGAEGRYNSGRLFVGVGVEYSKQFFTRDDPGAEYSQSHNLNPTVTIGARLTKRQEASVTYLFKDQDTYLYGARGNYSYAYPISERLSLVFGAEAGYYTFRETNRLGYRDRYYEKDTVLLFDIGVRFGSKRRAY